MAETRKAGEYATTEECRVLRARRMLAGLSQDEVAMRAGIDSSFLSRVERGRRRLTAGDAAAIAEALTELGAPEVEVRDAARA